jgi:hypothetical protein
LADAKSFIAGVLASYGIVNLLRALGVSLFVAMPVIVAGFDIGNIILSLVAIGAAYYLIKGK